MMNINTFVKALAATLLVSAACASHALAAADAPPVPRESMRITYLIFSGRSNPTVTLSPGDVYDVVGRQLSRARTMGAASPVQDNPPILGYNGILVEHMAIDGRIARYVVKGTRLQIDAETGTRSSTSASSAARGLEAALLSIGQSYGALDPSMMRLIRQPGR